MLSCILVQVKRIMYHSQLLLCYFSLRHIAVEITGSKIYNVTPVRNVNKVCNTDDFKQRYN